jgi:hypothetical protein
MMDNLGIDELRGLAVKAAMLWNQPHVYLMSAEVIGDRLFNSVGGH